MTVEFSPQFTRQFQKAPQEVRKAFGKQLGHLLRDFRHRSLDTEVFEEARRIWQARVNGGWRFRRFAWHGEQERGAGRAKGFKLASFISSWPLILQSWVSASRGPVSLSALLPRPTGPGAIRRPPHRTRPSGASSALVGGGTGLPVVRDIVAGLGVNQGVRFLGPRDDAPELMALSDVVVLPSVAAEGLPIVLPESRW